MIIREITVTEETTEERGVSLSASLTLAKETKRVIIDPAFLRIREKKVISKRFRKEPTRETRTKRTGETV